MISPATPSINSAVWAGFRLQHPLTRAIPDSAREKERKKERKRERERGIERDREGDKSGCHNLPRSTEGGPWVNRRTDPLLTAGRVVAGRPIQKFSKRQGDAIAAFAVFAGLVTVVCPSLMHGTQHRSSEFTFVANDCLFSGQSAREEACLAYQHILIQAEL